MKGEVFYEPHPSAPGRKAELVAKGYRIIDAKFKPEGYENPGEKPKKKALIVDESQE